MLRWISIADEGWPTVTHQNHYPAHMVRLVCVGQKDWVRIEKGELRFFGRDPKRPNWVSADNKMMTPLENDAWVVTHYLSGDLTEIDGWPGKGEK
jgi:hypothetical protein